MAYNNKWKGKGGGGGKTEYTADPLKQFLITRAVSLGQAVQLCIAGKIKLGDIQNTTDGFTLIQYGMIQVDAKIETEVIRIASKVQERAAKDREDQGEDQPRDEKDQQADEEAHAADQRDQEASERQLAEEEYNEAMKRDEKNDPPVDPVTYDCPTCDRKYKSAKGLDKHVQKVHKGD